MNARSPASVRAVAAVFVLATLPGCPLGRRASDDVNPDAASSAATTAAALPSSTPTPAGSNAAPPATTATATGTADAGGPVAPSNGRLALGKYGCTTSHYDTRSGSYEYRPKGSFVLGGDGSYTYHGFETQSVGRYRVDPRSGKLSFDGGYFDGGEATPIEGRKDQLLLVAPGIGSRWKCGLT